MREGEGILGSPFAVFLSVFSTVMLDAAEVDEGFEDVKGETMRYSFDCVCVCAGGGGAAAPLLAVAVVRVAAVLAGAAAFFAAPHALSFDSASLSPLSFFPPPCPTPSGVNLAQSCSSFMRCLRQYVRRHVAQSMPGTNGVFTRDLHWGWEHWASWVRMCGLFGIVVEDEDVLFMRAAR